MREQYEHALIQPNAKDKLVARRNRIRQEFLEEMKKINLNAKKEKTEKKLREAKQEFPKILEAFSKQYFGSNAEWADLSLGEKMELAKICGNYCKKWTAITAFPFIASFLSIVVASIIFTPVLFFTLLIWIIILFSSMVIILNYQEAHCHIDLDNWINYIISQNNLLKEKQDIKKILDANIEGNPE